MEILKTGRVWEFCYDAESKRYIVRSDIIETTYSFARQGSANKTFKELEERYKKY